ncbi:Oidioi.mRNA.OKI2018_I69.XSR.g13423.t1.cds [Oikopleura dioica]|uniref:Oidioi.mRNA.OKI2018_I69.XSR.g13423.t1.cds n=1 Tax=Oikopleura dioica TaxID=34765 RepID=A0ABN7S7B5_OIKDI|nr:Oidioi.mRNA.OKI2018_I69.XSR.g13423.t1.cds [Oikopleura dioica]
MDNPFQVDIDSLFNPSSNDSTASDRENMSWSPCEQDMMAAHQTQQTFKFEPISDTGYNQQVEFGSSSDYCLDFYNSSSSGAEFSSSSSQLWRNGQNPPISASWENMYENVYSTPHSNLYSLDQHVPEQPSFSYSSHHHSHPVFNGYGFEQSPQLSCRSHFNEQPDLNILSFQVYHPEKKAKRQKTRKVPKKAISCEEASKFTEQDRLALTPNHKNSIHLWQFLAELLNQQKYLKCIKWVDREQGIFKIEDSQEVAKLWGLRKNRPNMNYDKLSRSIRQYYKKGIIQKPQVSSRLVYQFSPKFKSG